VFFLVVVEGGSYLVLVGVVVVEFLRGLVGLPWVRGNECWGCLGVIVFGGNGGSDGLKREAAENTGGEARVLWLERIPRHSGKS